MRTGLFSTLPDRRCKSSATPAISAFYIENRLEIYRCAGKTDFLHQFSMPTKEKTEELAEGIWLFRGEFGDLRWLESLASPSSVVLIPSSVWWMQIEQIEFTCFPGVVKKKEEAADRKVTQEVFFLPTPPK